MQSSSFLHCKIESRRSPTITPTPAMRPGSLKNECSTETWIVHIGLTRTGDRTDHFKILPRHSRQRTNFLFAPDQRTLHRAPQTSSGLRNNNVLYLSLLHNRRNSDNTTTSRNTCCWQTSTRGTEPTLTCVPGSLPP